MTSAFAKALSSSNLSHQNHNQLMRRTTESPDAKV